MSFTDADLTALLLSLKLATVVTVVLLICSTPIALWLAHSKTRAKIVLSSIISMPLILPPTVLGFYLLILMGPEGPVGQMTQAMGLGTLPFTFTGLVVASVIYSLPFVVQPIQNAIEAIGKRPIEAAATLGAGPIDRFFNVVIPLAKPGFISAAILGFTHTIGEFGVVLMIGGNIEGETQVVSVQIYEHVESLAFAEAHMLAATLAVSSFIMLIVFYSLQPENLPFGSRPAQRGQ